VSVQELLMGKLSWRALEHDWIEYIADGSMVFGALALIILITVKQRWKWLWTEWLTTVDHKKIGIMYILVSALMLFKGLVDAGMMRAQQATSVGESFGYLHAPHFQQLFTAHGATMIFFVGMGLIFGVINLLLPMQIGARDVAFPFLNSLSFWLFTSGGLYIFISLVIGVFANTGWVAYPPLSGIKYNPWVGVDYWLWSVQISGAGSLLSGINFLVTIVKMRCPGMTWMKMPVFVWASFVALVLVIFAFPILTATVGMLSTDRLLGTHFFTAEAGGSPMMYINLIWAWGHPEVYILVLPMFGVFSEVVPTFCKKRLFGYTSMIWALVAIAFLSFIVWLHHFFTMGAGASVNAFFGIMTMVIAVPTGVKVFNWLFTAYRGKIECKTPMLWFFGFIILFTMGGMTGVLMSVPAIDFQMHNSLFLIAHFHNVIIGGVVFGFFAAYSFWFPKFIGFKLNEKWGVAAFWCWVVGFLVAFMPLYVLGLMGATRRLNHYETSTGWQPLFITAFIGFLIIFAGFLCQVIQLLVSIRDRKDNMDTTGDPWDARTLEWSTTSPPPFYNYAFTPEIHTRDQFWEDKQAGLKPEDREYEDIHMPSSTGAGFAIGTWSCVFGFAMVWQIWWLVTVSFVAMIVHLIMRVYAKNVDYYVPAAQVKEIEMKRGV